MRRLPHPVLAGAAVGGGAVLVSFAPCLDAPLSPAAGGDVLHLPLLSWWRNAPRILSADFTMFTDGQYRPGSYLLLALLRSFVSPGSVTFWHLLQVGLHLGNAALVGLVIHRLTGRRTGSLFGALVFALHPLATVVVNDIGSFHHLAGATCLSAALWAYLRFADGGSRRAYGLCLALFAAGLLVSKVSFVLPLLLAAYEGVYRRLPWRRTARRLGPFAAAIAVAGPLWWRVAPHPLHYTYTEFPPGTTWTSLYSVIGAVEHYAGGLLFGRGVPGVLHEAAARIHDPFSWRLWVWGAVCLAALAAGLFLLRRGRPWGLGLVWLLAAMLPFASTTWNRVEEFVAWEYLYHGLAGAAVVAGGLLPARRRAVAVGLWAGLGLLAVGQASLNADHETRERYWSRVLASNPRSETAALELGRELLRQGQVEEARRLLFAPWIKQVHDGSAALCRYYTETGQLLPAAVHLRMTVLRGAGLQYGTTEPLKAALMEAAGAYDHAEEALGEVLTANPCDTDAMARLGAIWIRKGHVAAARKLLGRIAAMAPGSPPHRRLQGELSRARKGDGPARVRPPSPAWLRYATRGELDAAMQEEILALAADYPDDPVIAVEAGVCLLRRGEHERALDWFREVTEALPSSAIAWSMRCWSATRSRAYEEAVAAGRRALELEPGSATVNNTVGILYGQLARLRPARAGLGERAIEHFRQVLRIDPQHASARTNLASELSRRGQTEEAERHYRRVLRYHPALSEAHFNLGNLLADRGDWAAAEASYRRAVESRPGYARALHNLGIALRQQQRFGEAAGQFAAALEAEPAYAPARDDLARLLVELGRHGEAAAVLRQGLRITPGHTRGALLLAGLLTTSPDGSVRDPAMAVRIARRVSQALGGGHAEALLVLAAAQAEAGDPGGALNSARRAVASAQELGDASLAGRARRDLSRYLALSAGG